MSATARKQTRVTKTVEQNYNFQPKNLKCEQGWSNRGYLPHFDGGQIAQFITFRLFDSMPQKLLDKWRKEISNKNGEIEFRRKIENYLDNGCGNCYLKNKNVAQIVQTALLFHHEKKYSLTAWTIMPNHVHCLLTPLKSVELSKITHSIKSFTAQKANLILGRTGVFWQHESFDRYIRNIEHFNNVVKYIESNPVAAGLCEKAEDWVFGSAFREEF